MKSHLCVQILCSDLYIICLQLLISYLGFYFYSISIYTTLLGTLSSEITRMYELASFLSLFIYNQVPNNMLQIRVTSIEKKHFEIKFETSVFETKIPSRWPFRSTRFRESRYLYSRHQAFSKKFVKITKLKYRIS